MPATPGSQLQKEYRREIRNQGYRIKVVEKTGATLKEVLQKSDPFKRQRCGREATAWSVNKLGKVRVMHTV